MANVCAECGRSLACDTQLNVRNRPYWRTYPDHVERTLCETCFFDPRISDPWKGLRQKYGNTPSQPNTCTA